MVAFGGFTVRQLLGVAALMVFVASCPADVPDAAKRLSSADNSVRLKAAEELSEAGADAKPALAALQKALAKDESKFVRRHAARALGNVGPDKKSVTVLAAALNDDDSGVRIAAARSLGKNGPDAIPALGKAVLSGVVDVKEPAVEALAKFGKPAFDALVNVVKDTKVDPSFRRVALGGLTKLGDDAKPAVKAITAAAKDFKGAGQVGQTLRVELFAFLGTYATKSDADAVRLLEGFAKDEKANNQLKRAAAMALKKIQAR